MDNGNNAPPSSTTPSTVVVQNVVNNTVTTVAVTPSTTPTSVAGNLNAASETTTARLIHLKVPVATPPVTSSAAMATPTPPRPPTPHSSIVVSTPTPTPSSAQSSPTTIAQAPPATSNIPRICNLGPLIYLQATGVKGGTPVNNSVSTGGNTAASTPVQFTMPQVISESSKNPRTLAGCNSQGWVQSRRIIAGNPQIIHTNNSQSNQAFAYLGTLIKQGPKGKETTSQKVLLTPMTNNKNQQIASVILPGNESQAHGNKTPMASLILQQGGNVQGKMTGLILGSPNSSSPGNKTSLLLPAPPGGAPGKKITNINIPVQTGKANVPNIIRQNTSVSGGKTFILPQSGNSPGLIIPASNSVGKPGANQVTGLILPSTSSSGLMIPPSSTTGSAPLTNLILTTQPTSSHQSTNPQMASLIISNPSSSSASSSTTTGIIVPAASGVSTQVSTSVTTLASSVTSTSSTQGTKMAGIFLPVSMEVQGKNNMTHHLTISNGKIHTNESSTITVPALKPVGGFGLPALQPISKEGSSISTASYVAKPGRSVLKKNIELALTSDEHAARTKKDDEPTAIGQDRQELIDITDNVLTETPEVETVEIKLEVGDRKPGVESDLEGGRKVKDVADYDPNKENTLPNVKDEDIKDETIKSELAIAPSPEDFDPMKVLEWDAKGVGKLPGSDLKFRLNEFGMMILHDENEIKTETDNTPTTPISEKKEEKKPHKDPVKASKNTDEIYCCDGCGCYGLSTEFLDTKYCSVACRKSMEMKCSSIGGGGGGGSGGGNSRRQKAAAEARDKLRDLKMRKKRRKMKIMEVKRRVEAAAAASAALDEFVEREDKKEIDWLQEFVVLKAKREAAANLCGGRGAGGGASGSQDEGVKCETTRASLDEAPSDVDVSASRSGTASPTLTDADELSQNDKKVPWLSKSGEFLWTVYLNHHKAKAAHIKLFKDPFPYQKNGFKVGMKLEGIDPEHQSYICVLTVAEVKGFRIRLHFDGYPENHDFWTNADSPDIFQPGWCEKNNHHLHWPRGYTKENFNWSVYLKQCKAQAAPRSLFSSRHVNPVTPNQFRVGMKLEAIDRHNSNLICVATVADIIDNRLLIHFDSWGDMYDYWVDPSSPYIHPVGWCKENGHELTPPNNYKSVSSFSWDAYLKETKSVAGPARAFKTRPPSGFRCDMRLEAVDKRAPHLVRVATVVAVNQHQIMITFDGFPEAFGYWVDDDSPDIHPVGWAHKTQHPLEPPPNASSDDKVECTTPGCRGDGNTKGTLKTTHDTAALCPYSPQFLNRDSILPDRFTVKHDIYELHERTSNKSKSSRESRESSVTTDGTGHKESYDGDSGDDINGRRSVTSNEDESRGSRTRQSNYKEEKRGRKRKTEKINSDVGTEFKKLRKDLIESVLKPGYHTNADDQSACWTKHSATFGLKAVDIHDNPINWNAKQVANFLSNIQPIKSKVFIDEEIDGEALLMLSQSDLTTHLGFKLGPAIKIYNMITILRQKVF